MKYGFTFSQKYCEELELDWKKTFEYMLDNLSFESVRLCAYWDRIEPKPGRFDFDELDWLIEEAEKKEVAINLAVGRKVPRWPEYHEPDWVLDLSESEFHDALLKFVQKVVERYKDRKSIVRFQIENEPLFAFGKSKSKHQISNPNLDEEINVVKNLTEKPILITQSGEAGDWKEASKFGDELGINMYSITYGLRGYNHYRFGPLFYFFKKLKIKKPVLVAELQAESWGPTEGTTNLKIKDLSEEEWPKSINPEQLQLNINKALDAGFKEIWLWGVEWWVLLHKRGYGGFIEFWTSFRKHKFRSNFTRSLNINDRPHFLVACWSFVSTILFIAISFWRNDLNLFNVLGFGVSVFLSWAIAREVDPVNNLSAYISAILGAFLFGLTGIFSPLSMGVILLCLRYISRVANFSYKPIDGWFLTLGVLIILILGGSYYWFLGILIGLSLILETLITKYRRFEQLLFTSFALVTLPIFIYWFVSGQKLEIEYLTVFLPFIVIGGLTFLQLIQKLDYKIDNLPLKLPTIRYTTSLFAFGLFLLTAAILGFEETALGLFAVGVGVILTSILRFGFKKNKAT